MKEDNELNLAAWNQPDGTDQDIDTLSRTFRLPSYVLCARIPLILSLHFCTDPGQKI